MVDKINIKDTYSDVRDLRAESTLLSNVWKNLNGDITNIRSTLHTTAKLTENITKSQREIRDLETATIALRAALTGHLVLSTLHTNDAAGAAIRLLDMGVEGYLVAATVCATMAQRLVRRICKNCKKPYKLSLEEKNFLKGYFGTSLDNQKFYCGEGCQYCNNTGYRGRMAIYEIMVLDDELRESIMNH